MNEARFLGEALPGAPPSKLRGTGRLRASLAPNPHWLVDQAVSDHVNEIKISRWSIPHAVSVAEYGLMHFTETKYDCYRRVPGSMRWWYKIT